MNMKESAEKYREYIVQERRFFHQHPELSFEEVETTAALKTELEAMGIPVTTFPDYTGLVGVIQGGKPGKTVMLRADIDALPVEEHTGEPWSATNGKMHACGHDCHMAMLLGAAKVLMECKEEIPGQVKLLFQAAEESCYGSGYYVKNGVLDDVDAIFGLHIWGTLDAPLISVEPGDRMASCDNFKIMVHGQSAHGSAPHLGVDAIATAAAIVMNLQTFVSRNNDPLNPLVVTIGTIKGGQCFNIIANEVVMEGTIRTFSRELRGTMEPRIRNIIDSTAKAYGATAELEYGHFPGPIINDHEDLVRIAQNAVVELYGKEGLGTLKKLTSSEDFSCLMEKVPGMFGFLGCRNPAIGAVYTNHNDKFTVDESVLPRGSALYAQFAWDYLNENA